MYENYIAELKLELELTDEYEDLYKSFSRNDIILILSTLHSSLLQLFKTMNNRLPTKDFCNHFWAEPSRNLIDIIDKIETLQRKLNKSEYAFKIEEYNKKIISKCNEFLSASGGSTIPENMDKIELFYATPIFIKSNSINVKHPNKNSVRDLTPIGEGSYALTYKYYDDFYDRYFVVKKAKKGLSEKELQRFKQEFEIMKSLNSPYIVDVYAYNENDNSSVIYTKLNNHKFLFMGDAGVGVEEDLIEKYNLQNIDVLKVGHHGSKTSSGKEFINEINPKYSIISVGKNNRYGHPNKEVLNNLSDSKIYRTDQNGSVMFKIKNNKLKIETCSP